ncbi:MAG: ribonuclease D [Gemmatimonadales bacterium]|nr:ribonuclease D [Gemmatimonadales bacterium]
MPPPLIAHPAEFTQLLDSLRGESPVAVDTEAASFHRYHDRVYLLQLSTRRETHLVDPVAVPGLPGFGDFLADERIELIFHDADYDLRLLQHEFGFRATRLFDTRVAAQFLNEPGIGLAALLEKHLGVQLDKRFQRADWAARPLTDAMLEYAAMDTRHLPVLRDLLGARLDEKGRLSWVAEECELLTAVRWPDPVPREEAALSVKGARALSPRALAVFRELHVWRDRTAEALDRAAFRVMVNEVLLAMAERPPATLAELASVRGVGREIVERRGPEILGAIERGLAIPESDLPKYPRVPRHKPDPAFDLRLERLRAVRATLVAEFDLQPGVLCPNWLLEGIARGAPGDESALAQVPGVRRWQIETFGPRLLSAVAA